MTEHYIAAGLIFIATFYLVISGKVDRTIASFAGALAMVAAGSALGFYSQEDLTRMMLGGCLPSKLVVVNGLII